MDDGLARYILTPDRKVVRCASLGAWARWFEQAENRIVRKTDVAGCEVSTVFLGLNHNWGDGPPVLWETMVFGDTRGFDLDQDRCGGTWEQAEEMHWKMCDAVADALGVPHVEHVHD